MFSSLLSLFLTLVPSGSASIAIPRNLTSSDRVEIIKSLGAPTATHLTSNPYPLGGYEGFEFALSIETIDTENLSQLGSGAPKKSSVSYPLITIGKGLYQDIDVFIHFLPFIESSDLSQYGGSLRWKFYQLRFWPVSFSMFAHKNSVNVSNLIVFNTWGYALSVNWNLGEFSAYTGIDRASTRGKFIGDIEGANDFGITAEGETRYEVVTANHTFAGMAYSIGNVFLGLQVDFHQSAVVSTKLGMRY